VEEEGTSMAEANEKEQVTVDEEIISVKSDSDGVLRIPNAHWPHDAPHRDETYVLSVLTGEFQYRWAIHEGFSEQFFPIVFWR
jgi:hypothetical protein